MRFLLLATVLGLAEGARAEALELSWPVDCARGENCWIVAHVDHDPSPGARDFSGGVATRDGHRGVDIAAPHLAAIEAGIEVLAAAPGVVSGARDGMQDRLLEDPSDVAGRECGNGVSIDHGAGWETQYCHLRRGSVRVAPGDRIERGQPLGAIGLSGSTTFPHLHLSVRKNGATVDPFTGAATGEVGGSTRGALWREGVVEEGPARRLVLTRIGVADEPPEDAELRAGGHGGARLAANDVAVLWIEGYGAEPGDVLGLEVLDEAGQIAFASQSAFESGKAYFNRYAGLRSGFEAGAYLGRAEIVDRDGRRLDALDFPFEVEP